VRKGRRVESYKPRSVKYCGKHHWMEAASGQVHCHCAAAYQLR
jgi:hypothetical protein